MVLKLYAYPLSAPSRNVLAALFEKEVEFEYVHVDLPKGEHKSPEHLERHPLGKVPVIDDDGFVLFESRAIIRHLAYKYGGQGASLYGDTPEKRSLVEQWTEAEGQNWIPIVSVLNYELFIKKLFSGQEQDPAIVEAQEKKFNGVLDVYERRLSKSKYLAGDFFSIADLVHLGSTHTLTTAAGRADLIASRPRVAAWWEDISKRPSWQKVISYTASLSDK